MRPLYLAAIVPVVLAGGIAQAVIPGPASPCIALQSSAVRFTALPWREGIRVAFTDNAAKASVSVQLVDDPLMADLAFADDAPAAEPSACLDPSTSRYVSITRAPEPGAPVIHLTDADDADYRIYLRSKSVTAQEAAAMLVAAMRDPLRVASTAR
jgi:hypothetical protein